MFSLVDFFETVVDDPRISANHIAIYLALRSKWEAIERPEVLHVDSFEIMRFAKIRKRTTYLRHLKELRMYGYIKYLPACNEYVKAEIVFKRL